jgi:hypothetical protein
LPEPHVRVTRSNKEIEISSGRVKMGFASRGDPDPVDKETAALMSEDRDWVALPPDFFEALRAVRFSASGDATRGPLTCVCFRDRHALSGDDSRASRFTLNKAAPEPFLLPASSADILLKVPRFGLLAVDRYFLEREKESPRCRIHFRGEELLFSAESTTGEYPAWVAALFETRPPSWMIELPEGLAKAAKAGWELVAPTDSEFEGDTKVTLGFEGRKVTILARGMKEGDSRHFNAEFVLPHAVEEPLTLEVRPRHLYEALRRFRAMSPPYAATIEGRAATAVSFHSGGSRHVVVLDQAG